MLIDGDARHNKSITRPVRDWLIRILAGKTAVMVNVSMAPVHRYNNLKLSVKTDFFSYNCDFPVWDSEILEITLAGENKQ